MRVEIREETARFIVVSVNTITDSYIARQDRLLGNCRMSDGNRVYETYTGIDKAEDFLSWVQSNPVTFQETR